MFESLHFHRIEISFFEKGFRLYAFGFPALLISTYLTIGYMQIYEECHRDRMERLNVTDLTNPYQNVLVGIDYLSELIERYGTIQDALAAYNYGEQGAKQHLWKNGIYVYEYNQTIMSRMKEIEEELEQDAGD